MKTSILSSILRNTGMIYAFDHLRFQYLLRKNSAKNTAFLKENPAVVLPPDYLMYESFQLDYRKYYVDSRDTANWLCGLLQAHGLPANAAILDWGCGPGRIIRHLPSLLPVTTEFTGTDYNETTVEWCQNKLPGIRFFKNKLSPPLAFEPASFDAIYGISIFTHLSEAMHLAWSQELQRVLKPGGLLLLTAQGNAFAIKLLEHERKEFQKGKLVVRGKVKEGHRTYSAFQPPEYFRNLFKDLDVLEHQERTTDPNTPQQDVWIFRKP